MLTHATKRLLVLFFEGAVLIILVLMAAYVSMGRILINSVDSYTVDLEEILSSSLNIPVSLETMTGQWTYLNPTFGLVDLKIGTDLNPAVNIQNLSVEIDTLASLRELKIVVSGIDLSGLKFTIVQQDNGGWAIRGLPSRETKINFDPILDAILHLDRLSLDTVMIGIKGEQLAYTVTSINDEPFELSLEDEVKTLSWPLFLTNLDVPENDPARIHLLGQYQGDPRDRKFESELFFNLPTLDIANFLPPMSYKEIRLSELLVNGQFWLNSTVLGSELTGMPIVESLVVKSDSIGEVQVLKDVEIEFLFHTEQDQEGLLQIKRVEGFIGSELRSMSDLSMVFDTDGDETDVAIHLPLLHINQFSTMLSSLESKLKLFPPELVPALQQLNLQGQIKDLYLIAQLNDDLTFDLIAELSNVSIDRYKQALSISHLNGLVRLGNKSGYFDIHNETSFNAFYPLLFPAPWYFDSTHARINYTYLEETLKIYSNLVEVKKDDLLAKGRFQISLPKDELAHTWALELGVRNAELLDSFRFLPNTLSPELSQWLRKSVIGGVGRTAGMVFHGSLNRNSPKDQKAFEIFFEVEDTIFEYDIRWPRFDDLEATIYAGNNEIVSNNANARVFDSKVINSEIMVPIPEDGLVDTVLVKGLLTGPVSDGLRLLNETPLFLATGKMAEFWEGEGQMNGLAQMNVPIGRRANEVAMVDLKVNLIDAKITMPQYDIDLSHLNGIVNYETVAGISSSSFSGELFNENITGTIRTIGEPDSGVIDINVQGKVDVKSLYEWTQQPLLTRGEGVLHYDSTLHVPYGDRSSQGISIDATSDLVGVSINMPTPMGKDRLEKLSMEYTQIFLEPVSRIIVNLGEEVKAELQIMDDVLTGGRIHLGKDLMGAVTFDKLKVSGSLLRVNYEMWDEMIIDLQNLSDVSLEGELAETLDAIEVNVGVLDVYGFEIDDVLTRITRKSTTWDVALKSAMLVGTVLVHDESPLKIDLDYLKVESTEINEDPLEDADPSTFELADVTLDKLWVGEEDYGSWSFRFTPQDMGGRIDNLIANVKGFELMGEGEVTWEHSNNEHNSGFRGKVLVPDLAYSLREWGFASSIEGKDFEFSSDVTWPGTPAMVDLDIISGKIKLESGSGRFVQAESNVGALKLLGIFDFASLARRFRLDFSDVVKSGFTFSNISGVSRFSHGLVDVVDPLVIEGSSSIFKVAGQMDLESEVIDSDMVVTLPVNRNLPWYAAYTAFVVGPLTGAGVFLAQKLFKNQIDTMSSAKYKITGTIDEPLIEFVSIFDASVRQLPEDGENAITKEADGSLPQGADGSLLQEADGSLLQEADGSLLQEADGSLLQGADGSLLQDADGS